jgi:hypothetical protein
MPAARRVFLFSTIIVEPSPLRISHNVDPSSLPNLQLGGLIPGEVACFLGSYSQISDSLSIYRSTYLEAKGLARPPANFQARCNMARFYE